MLRSEGEINGVEYSTRSVIVDPMLDKKTRLLVPRKVDGLPLRKFLLLNHAKRAPDPEREIVWAYWLDRLYRSFRCYHFLLRRRKFNPMRLSFRDPFFKELRETWEPEPTADHVLDSVDRLLKWVNSSSETTESLFQKALYVHPEWFPLAYVTQSPREVLRKLMDDLLVEAKKQLIETRDSLEDLFDNLQARWWGAFLYVAEKMVFFIYGKGMKDVYRRVESELTPPQQKLFKEHFLWNSAHLYRIRAFDRSPIVQEYEKMREQIGEALRKTRISRCFTPGLWRDIWRGYLALYPPWTMSVREAEKERERKARKTGRQVPLEEWSEKYIKEGVRPDYMSDPLILALRRSGYRWDDSPRGKSTSERSKKRKAVSAETFLSELERNVLVLVHQGIKQKDIARKVDRSPSSVCKIRKRAEKRLLQGAENMWKDARKKYYREIREYRYKTSKGIPPGSYEATQVILEPFIEALALVSKRDAKELEEDLLRPLKTT